MQRYTFESEHYSEENKNPAHFHMCFSSDAEAIEEAKKHSDVVYVWTCNEGQNPRGVYHPSCEHCICCEPEF